MYRIPREASLPSDFGSRFAPARPSKVEGLVLNFKRARVGMDASAVTVVEMVYVVI
jgi:hypothetical protein